MDFLTVLALIGAALVIMIPIWIWQAKRTREHKDERVALFTQFAQQRGWAYQPENNGFADRFSGHAPFPTVGQNLFIRHLLSGEYRGRQFSCFQYGRKHDRPGGTTSDRTRTFEYFHVYALLTPASRPTLQVTRAGVGSKIAAKFGRHDFQTGNPPFDEAFTVDTDNDRFAADVLHPGMTQWLLADPRAPRSPFRFERNELVAWLDGVMEPGMIEPALDYLGHVLDLVPKSVWR